MRVERSPLLNEFVSFWFETRIDSELRFETFLDFRRGEWCTCKAGDDGLILLRGQFDVALPEKTVVARVSPISQSAIDAGRI